MRMLATVFKTILTYQEKQYDFSVDQKVKEWMEKKWVVLAEGELYSRAKIYEQETPSLSRKLSGTSTGSILDIFHSKVK